MAISILPLQTDPKHSTSARKAIGRVLLAFFNRSSFVFGFPGQTAQWSGGRSGPIDGESVS
jgi:hypothetical protein